MENHEPRLESERGDISRHQASGPNWMSNEICQGMIRTLRRRVVSFMYGNNNTNNTISMMLWRAQARSAFWYPQTHLRVS